MARQGWLYLPQSTTSTFSSGLVYSIPDRIERPTTQGSKRRNKLGFRRNVVCLCLYYYGLLQPCLWGNIIMLRFFWYVTSTRKMRRRMESPLSRRYFSTNSWIQSKTPLYYMGLLNRQLTPAFIVDTVCRPPSGCLQATSTEGCHVLLHPNPLRIYSYACLWGTERHSLGASSFLFAFLLLESSYTTITTVK